MKDNIVKDKSYSFAKKIVEIYRLLCNEKREFVLSNQLLRSGTAIGALIREAIEAESKADFIHKLSISLKEARETEYWISLLHDTNYLDDIVFKSIYKDIDELLRLITSIIKSSRNNI